MGYSQKQKSILAKALQFGRDRQSKYTGFFHYCFEDPASKETIPLLENFLFSFALFSTHTQVQMLEGKDLLLRLLKFQTEEGLFPLYMHEFPVCRKPLANVKHLLALFHLFEAYGNLLGGEGKSALLLAIEKLDRALEAYRPLPPILAFQKGAFDYRSKRGEKPSFQQAMTSSNMWEEYAYAASLLREEFSIPWHPTYHRYAGPLIEERRKESIPEPTIFDHLLMQAGEREEIQALHALLALDATYSFAPYSLPGWEFYEQDPFYLIFLSRMDGASEEKRSPYLHLFEVFNKEHSLVCQESRMKEVHLSKTPIGFEALFTYPVEGKEEDVELSLFINREPTARIMINEVRATCFALQDKIEIFLGEGRIGVTFQIVEGEGEFVGHLSYGNRPAQISKKVKEEYAAFDWKISLRTLTRSPHFVLKAQFTLNS